MTEMKFQLKGPVAILALLVVGCVLAFQVIRVRTLGTEQLGDVRTWLAAEYTSSYLPDLRAAVEEGSREEGAKVAEAVLEMQNIRFESVKAKGRDPVIVRVEISVNGQPPPTGKRVRYFELTHSTVSGWRVHREVGAFSYYLKLL